MSLQSIRTTCTRCARQSLISRAALAGPIPIYARSIYSSPPRRNIDAEREAARQRAWYLDPPPAQLGPSTTTTTPPSSSPSPLPSASTAKISTRQPVFTSYDPLRTTPTLDAHTPSAPLPSNTPAHLIPLHEFLTTSELIQGGSVVFVHTPSSAHARSGAVGSTGSGGVGPRRLERGQQGGMEGMEEMDGMEDVSGAEPSWEWVVMGVVKGRGKGVVARAERALRVWLKDNQEPKLRTNRPPRRMPRVEAEADWSVVPIGEGICVNLFTAEGRDKWRLDELWTHKE